MRKYSRGNRGARKRGNGTKDEYVDSGLDEAESRMTHGGIDDVRGGLAASCAAPVAWERGKEIS